MEKVYNEEWMKDILGRSKEAMDDSSGSLPEIDWVQYKKGFKKGENILTFLLLFQRNFTIFDLSENNFYGISFFFRI